MGQSMLLAQRSSIGAHHPAPTAPRQNPAIGPPFEQRRSTRRDPALFCPLHISMFFVIQEELFVVPEEQGAAHHPQAAVPAPGAREIARGMQPKMDLRFQSTAILALHEASDEDYLRGGAV